MSIHARTKNTFYTPGLHAWNSKDDEDKIVATQTANKVVEYDAPLEPPPMLQMGTMLGLMVLTKRMDMFDPKIVRLGR